MKYEFIKSALWQTEDGKFISLDHAIPIGANGITLTEYYGTKPTPTEATQPTTEATVTTTEATVTTTAETTTVTNPTASTDGTEISYGDVDCNGAVELLDVITLNKNLLGITKLDDKGSANADVDCSDVVDGTDSLLILKSIVSLVTLPFKG